MGFEVLLPNPSREEQPKLQVAAGQQKACSCALLQVLSLMASARAPEVAENGCEALRNLVVDEETRFLNKLV